jgi:hypothetical protein
MNVNSVAMRESVGFKSPALNMYSNQRGIGMKVGGKQRER